MKYFWLHSVRAYIKLAFFFYLKKIEINNEDRLPKNKPVIILANHQNALIDPLLIASQSKVFSYFLTRAGVFKKPIVKKILKSLQMLPVYRVRDGWSNLTNNTSIFLECSKLLSKNKVITIFPEGNHNIQRRVRPLSKGFTRIVFETLESFPEADLQLIPIGLNYKKANQFGDSAAVYFGESISAKSYLNLDRNEAIKQLKNDVQLALKMLTTHIPETNYRTIETQLEQLNVDFLNPIAVNNCIASNFKSCKATNKLQVNNFKKLFKFLLVLLLIVPFIVWKYVAKPKIKEIEFIATFRFTIAITLVPLWIVLITVILGLTLGWFVGVIYLVSVFTMALLAVKL